MLQSIPRIILGVVGGGLLYAFAIVVYRVSFHPLAKYPGPLLAKVTDWYSVYHAWKGDRHLEFWRTHEKYGKFVRFGPNSLSINSNTALKEIYGFNSNVRKSQFYSVFPATKDTTNTHNSIDKAAHARKRRVLSQAFSDNAIKAMEKYIVNNIRTFCERLGTNESDSVEKKGWSIPQNMADWCNYLTFDIMGDLCFGKAFGMLEKPDNHFAINLIGNAAHRHLICGTLPMIHEYHLDKILFRRISSGRERYMAYSKSQALERTKMGQDTDRRDFFYYLLNAKDPETGKGFSTPELWGESNLLIIAGSDTTSTALASSFFHLVHNTAAFDKVTEEVRSTFSDAEEISSGPTLSSCTYLRACIDEAMRLSPPVGGILPREVLPGGIEIDGHKIPAGIIVGTPHYTIHHNEQYYPKPFSFIPERWLIIERSSSTPNTESNPSISSESQVKLARSAFCPFSIGPRGCIGKGVAYTELMIAMARTLFTYDIRLAPGVPPIGYEDRRKTSLEADRRDVEAATRVAVNEKDLFQAEYKLKDCFTSMKDGPMVEFRRRELM